jgi:hypothetical protein
MGDRPSSTRLRCALTVDYPLATQEHYTLQFWFSRTSERPLECAFSVCSLPAGVPTDVELVLPRGNGLLPTSLNLRLYALGAHEPPALSEMCLACAFFPTWLLVRVGAKQRVVLADVDGRPQGTLEFEHDDAALALRISDAHVPEPRQGESLSEQLIEEIESVYNDNSHYTHNKRQVFYRVSTDNGHAPLICFPLLATLSAPLQETQGRFLLRLMNIACLIEGVNPDDGTLDRLPLWKTLRVVNEMGTALTKCLLYASDASRKRTADGETVQLFNEFWERILLYPHLAAASYDCEDGAFLVQEILHPLRTSNLLPTPLRGVRKLLAQYTVFTCEGDLDVGGGKWTPHAYCVMHDSAYIDYVLGRSRSQDGWLPSVVYESTNWIGGVWDQPPERLNTSESMVKKSTLVGQTVKAYMSAQEARAQHVYGVVAQMQTADHRGRLLNLMCTTGSAIGVELSAFMEHTAQPGQLVVKGAVETPRDLQTLKDELLDLPPSYLPRWPKNEDTGLHMDHVEWEAAAVVRLFDYEDFAEELHYAFPDAATRDVVHVTMEGCAFVLVRVGREAHSASTATEARPERLDPDEGDVNTEEGDLTRVVRTSPDGRSVTYVVDKDRLVHNVGAPAVLSDEYHLREYWWRGLPFRTDPFGPGHSHTSDEEDDDSSWRVWSHPRLPIITHHLGTKPYNVNLWSICLRNTTILIGEEAWAEVETQYDEDHHISWMDTFASSSMRTSVSRVAEAQRMYNDEARRWNAARRARIAKVARSSDVARLVASYGERPLPFPVILALPVRAAPVAPVQEAPVPYDRAKRQREILEEIDPAEWAELETTRLRRRRLMTPEEDEKEIYSNAATLAKRKATAHADTDSEDDDDDEDEATTRVETWLLEGASAATLSEHEATIETWQRTKMRRWMEPFAEAIHSALVMFAAFRYLNDSLVGLCSVARDGGSARALYISWLRADKAGRVLVEAVKEWAVDHDYKFLSVDDIGSESRAFYEHMGFKTQSERSRASLRRAARLRGALVFDLPSKSARLRQQSEQDRGENLESQEDDDGFEQFLHTQQPAASQGKRKFEELDPTMTYIETWELRGQSPELRAERVAVLNAWKWTKYESWEELFRRELDRGLVMFAAFRGGRLVGLCSVEQNRKSPNTALYITWLRATQAGLPLVEAVKEWGEDHAYSYLGVLPTSSKAETFYKKVGFVEKPYPHTLPVEGSMVFELPPKPLRRSRRLRAKQQQEEDDYGFERYLHAQRQEPTASQGKHGRDSGDDEEKGEKRARSDPGPILGIRAATYDDFVRRAADYYYKYPREEAWEEDWSRRFEELFPAQAANLRFIADLPDADKATLKFWLSPAYEGLKADQLRVLNTNVAAIIARAPPLEQPWEVYRGVGNPRVEGKWVERHIYTVEVRREGCMATAYSYSKAKSFGGAVTLRIRVPAGTHFLFFDGLAFLNTGLSKRLPWHSSEGEVLLPPDSLLLRSVLNPFTAVFLQGGGGPLADALSDAREKAIKKFGQPATKKLNGRRVLTEENWKTLLDREGVGVLGIQGFVDVVSAGPSKAREMLPVVQELMLRWVWYAPDSDPAEYRKQLVALYGALFPSEFRRTDLEDEVKAFVADAVPLTAHMQDGEIVIDS